MSRKNSSIPNQDPAIGLKAAKKAKDAASRTGARNIAPAATLAGAAHLFADPVMAAGFFADLSAKPFSDAEKKRLRAIGESLLAPLAEATADQSTKSDELIVSIPATASVDLPERLIGMGLKQTSRIGANRTYIEYRGRADFAVVEAAIAPVGGITTLIRRPELPSTFGVVEAPIANVDTVVEDLADTVTDNLAPVTHLEALETALEAAIRSGGTSKREPESIELSPSTLVALHEPGHQLEAPPEIRHHTISAAAKPTPDDKKTKANSRSADEPPKPFVEADGVATSTAAQTLKPLPGLGSPMTRIVPPFLPRPNQGAMRRPT
jgi:hypothetical protein